MGILAVGNCMVVVPFWSTEGRRSINHWLRVQPLLYQEVGGLKRSGFVKSSSHCLRLLRVQSLDLTCRPFG